MMWMFLACSPGAVTLGDPGDGEDTGSTQDTGAEDSGQEEVHDPAGDYQGSFEVSIYWKAWDFGDTCSSEDLQLEVSSHGEVEGYAECLFDWGQDGTFLFELWVEGELDDDHQMEGTGLVHLQGGVREDDTQVEGDFSEEDASLGGSGDMTAYNETMDYEFTMELELE